MGKIRKLMGNPIKYMDLYLKPIELDGKLLGMVGKWLGNIQPMCSAPGHSWQGPFFPQKSGPFYKKCFFWFFVGGDE